MLLVAWHLVWGVGFQEFTGPELSLYGFMLPLIQHEGLTTALMHTSLGICPISLLLALVMRRTISLICSVYDQAFLSLFFQLHAIHIWLASAVITLSDSEDIFHIPMRDIEICDLFPTVVNCQPQLGEADRSNDTDWEVLEQSNKASPASTTTVNASVCYIEEIYITLAKCQNSFLIIFVHSFANMCHY